MATVFDAAAYIIKKLGPVTSMKLQKLVYYSQAWNVVWNDNTLFPEKIEAWKLGPVTPALWNETKGAFKIEGIAKGSPDAFSSDEIDSLDKVVAFYGSKDAQWLSDLTHLEDPWKNAYANGQNSEITPGALSEYYSSLT